MLLLARLPLSSGLLSPVAISVAILSRLGIFVKTLSSVFSRPKTVLLLAISQRPLVSLSVTRLGLVHLTGFNIPSSRTKQFDYLFKNDFEIMTRLSYQLRNNHEVVNPETQTQKRNLAAYACFCFSL